MLWLHRGIVLWVLVCVLGCTRTKFEPEGLLFFQASWHALLPSRVPPCSMCTGVAVQGLLVVRMCCGVDVGIDSRRWFAPVQLWHGEFGLSKLLAGSLLQTAATVCL